MINTVSISKQNPLYIMSTNHFSCTAKQLYELIVAGRITVAPIINCISDQVAPGININSFDLLSQAPSLYKELIEHYLHISEPLKTFLLNNCYSSYRKQDLLEFSYRHFLRNFGKPSDDQICEYIINLTNDKFLKWKLNPGHSYKLSWFEKEQWVTYGLFHCVLDVELRDQKFFAGKLQVGSITYYNSDRYAKQLYYLIQAMIDKGSSNEKEVALSSSATNSYIQSNKARYTYLGIQNKIIILSGQRQYKFDTNYWIADILQNTLCPSEQCKFELQKAYIDVLKTDNTVASMEIEVCYFEYKKIYFITGAEFARIISTGTPLCVTYLYKENLFYSSSFYSLNYALEQPVDIKLLMDKLGYKLTDNNLSRERRQVILRYIIQKPLAKFSEVKQYLEQLLYVYQCNSEIVRCWDVINKLQEDIRFLKRFLLSADLRPCNYEIIRRPDDV